MKVIRKLERILLTLLIPTDNAVKLRKIMLRFLLLLGKPLIIVLARLVRLLHYMVGPVKLLVIPRLFAFWETIPNKK